MAWLGSIAQTVLKNIFAEDPPDQVQEVKTTDYQKRRIHCREDGILLYTPGSNKDKEKFEIVLHKPYSEKLNYVGYRYNNLTCNYFLIFKEKILYLFV